MQYRLSTIFLVFFVVAASLALFKAWGLLVAPVALVMALLLYLVAQGKMTLTDLFFAGVILFITIGLIMSALQRSRGSGFHPLCTNNMKQLGLALWNYHDAHKCFPPLIVRDAKGQPLYSWMVAILPNMEHDTVYNQFNRGKPWDSAQNAAVLNQNQIAEFVCPNREKISQGPTTDFLAIIGPGTIWRSEGAVSSHDLPNKTSITVAAVEGVGHEKPWTEPYALTAEEVLQQMAAGRGTRIAALHNNRVNVLFADGSVYGLRADTPLAVWRKLLMGEMENPSELDEWKAPLRDSSLLSRWDDPPEPGKWPFLLSIAAWLVSLVLLFRRAWNSGAAAGIPVTSPP